MTRVLDAIDADGHIAEPVDLWERYIEPKYREDCPRIFIEPGGVEKLRIDADTIAISRVTPKKPSIATGSVFGGRDAETSTELNYLDGEPGGFDPHERIKWMDREGFDGAFLFPTNSLPIIWAVSDPKRAAAITDAYNRYLVDFVAPYRDRLFGIALLPMASLQDAIDQVKRFKKAGLNAGCVRPNPVGGKPLHHRDWYPLWEVCQDEGFGIAVHGSAGPENLGTERFRSGANAYLTGGENIEPGSYAVEHCFSHTAEMMAAVTSFVLAGVCDRHPRLRVAFVEAGGAWLPGYIDRMDRHFDDVSANDLSLKDRPSEIFNRQCVVTFEPVETSIRVLASHFGPDKMMVATDFPHGDGFPNAVRLIRGMGLAPEVEQALFSHGAKAFYALDA
jgi:predicted TIM-barrel fold metal-dependent hydrolase